MSTNTNMEHSQIQRSSRPPSTSLSPLKQHPITPVTTTFSPPATQTIFLDHPSARLSSSPASSPRIVDQVPTRRSSVYPAMSDTMERGLVPGADFFDDESSESDWEDSDGDITQNFSNVDGQGLRSLVHGLPGHDDEEARGRSRERNTLTALPLFERFSTGGTGLGIVDIDSKALPGPMNAKDTNTAREMSLKRLDKQNVRVVHNRSIAGTPRSSINSNSLVDDAPSTIFSKPFSEMRSMSADATKSSNFRGRHRRNTSESVIAGSIINAHVRTMRALESLGHPQSKHKPDAENQSFPKSSSLTQSRHITLSPLRMTNVELDRNRPPHLPDHFIRTPYPFTAKKEFPKPKSRPRRHSALSETTYGEPGERERLDSGYSGDVRDEYNDRKGKHVLGLMSSDGVYDLRSRLQRNGDAQGVVWSQNNFGRDAGESVIWMSLERKSLRGRKLGQEAKKLAKIVIPNSLTTSTLDCDGPKGHNSTTTIDFDDELFAKRLRSGHHQLAGSWLRRIFSARQLCALRLASVSTWSGCPLQLSSRGTSKLLAAGAGIDLNVDTRSPFTEDELMRLYAHPTNGKARYTWVHWARRVVSSSTRSSDASRPSTQGSHQRARSLSAIGEKDDILSGPIDSAPGIVSDSITTIQFVHGLSSLRVMMALALMLIMSVTAAVLWVFLGTNGTGWGHMESMQRSNRVGSGMAIGILVLLLESLGFGAWLLLS